MMNRIAHWRRAAHVHETVRMLRAARYLYSGGCVTSAWMSYEFGICKRHATRDMHLLRSYLPVWVVRGPRGQHRLTVRRHTKGIAP